MLDRAIHLDQDAWPQAIWLVLGPGSMRTQSGLPHPCTLSLAGSAVVAGSMQALAAAVLFHLDGCTFQEEEEGAARAISHLTALAHLSCIRWTWA